MTPCYTCAVPCEEGLTIRVDLTGNWNLLGESERWFCLRCAGRVMRNLEARGFTLDETAGNDGWEAKR